MADRSHGHEAVHPTPFTYLKVAFALVVLTGIEVGVFYIDALESAFLAIFLILSVVKFALVVMFYMHLKFDHRLFSWVFVGGLLLAVAVSIALMSLFQVLSSTASQIEGSELVTEVEGAGEPPTVPTLIPTSVPQTTVAPTTEPERVEATQPPAITQAAPTVAAPQGDLVALGEQLFMTAPANDGAQALWCSTCHIVEGMAAGRIGPDLTHIGTDAATRKPGMSAEDYLRESIRSPEAHVAQGVERATKGLMTTAITKELTDGQVDALIAFLLTHK